MNVNSAEVFMQKFEIYSEDTGKVFKIVEAETETAASIVRDVLISELKSKHILGPDRLFIRKVKE